VSAASAWEIATKHRIGKLPEAGDVVGQFPAYLRKARFTAFDISVDHALFAGSLPGPHRDPFDRMLIAQARLHSFPIVTIDPIFADYGVRVIW
jgi:PIN domain nuclease of toxin-antitoxin system